MLPSSKMLINCDTVISVILTINIVSCFRSIPVNTAHKIRSEKGRLYLNTSVKTNLEGDVRICGENQEILSAFQ